MSLAKFIISAVLAGIFLYLVIIGIQNMMQAKKEVEEAEKELEETNRELQHWTSEAEKSRAFYKGSHISSRP